MQTNEDISLEKKKIISMSEFLHSLLLHYCNNVIYNMASIKHLKDGTLFSAIFQSFQHFQRYTF